MLNATFLNTKQFQIRALNFGLYSNRLIFEAGLIFEQKRYSCDYSPTNNLHFMKQNRDVFRWYKAS